MLNQELHRLLKRQIKKTGLNIQDNPAFDEFLNLINDAYKDFDKDFNHIENILEESSKELFVANQKLIAERDNTKTQLVNIVDNIGGVIFETDLDGNFTFLNSAWEKYSGIPVEACLGENFMKFLKGEYIEGSAKLNNLFSLDKEEISFIFKFSNAGKFFWFEVKSKRVRNKEGVPFGYTGTIMDITYLKETEIELQKASKAKDEFFSTMSHEIRTPLNAVTGLTNIMLMEQHLPEQLENLNALKYSGDHLLGLINDLLDFDKIKSGKLKLVEKDFNLNYFFENIESHFKLSAERKSLIFQIIKDADVPNNIIGDQLKLSQILKNLLSNALKFTEKGSIRLHIVNKGIKRNKVKLEFIVTDTGIGISEDKQKTIFESFVQADSQTSIKYGGTGLGLSISKKLLNLQNSDLNVSSEIGEGATFSFEITYKISNRLDVYNPNMIKSQPNYEPLKISILVAEDNKMNVLILKRLFSKWKVDFQVAENGEEVLKKLEQSHFDLILMDLQMPILDGYQTTTRIRNLQDYSKASIPIIALTAFAQTDIKAKTKRYKMDGFLGKPFNPEKLYLLIKSYSEILINKEAI
ncbi:ATP-binding protein [Seonamhaeicola sp. MEBiC1930]|uniref:PAS domain-containing sensor histidine kinase n=1 Tax=Seonamhaeicola sp. MEBiC01930 TaxID=2976768 RepID=UPI00324A1935